MSLRVPPEADAAQRRSSDPAASVWVSANAGAGKTYVLAQRVVRLLLSGVPPRAILCLTYTTAAAAEMAQRVYNELAALATMDDADLLARVALLAPGAEPAAAAERARTLFAEALETPGGLKVQTIHAFAAALLRRFPLEANVSGSLQVLDDPTREDLTDRAIAAVLSRAVADPTGPVAQHVETLMPHVSDVGLGKYLKAAVGEHRRLGRWLRSGSSAAALTCDLRAALALPDPVPPLGEDVCRRLRDAIVASGSGKASAERIAAALGCREAERAPLWATIFLTTSGAPRALSGVVPKSVLADWPELEALIAAEQERLGALAEAERLEAAIAATVPLMQLAWLVEEELSAAKRRRGLIDYDDQIETAMHLVRSGSAAAWVRYKLDEGIDHVMVDEAQDTSPPQWMLVEALTEEFFAGAGARPVNRTLFVVGDEKQSIYSFQGAAPRLFGEKRASYSAMAAAVKRPLHCVALQHSMRSMPQVLSAVDRVFASDDLAAAVGAPAGGVRHLPVKDGPGGVDLWPLFCDDEEEKPEAWDAPFDQAPDNAGSVKLVRAIADTIQRWTGVEGPAGGPRIRPGDVMILSRRRGTFASLMNRELKARGIPAAGADRLEVTGHIAVKDMIALARALIARDDLSLAAVLKSPLFGFDDDALFRVARERAGTLFAALAGGDEAARDAHATLERWRTLAQTARPFDFFAQILLGEGRRADFAARMGAEAQDALDALLEEALAFERRDVPALETFLARLARTKTELRRVSDGTEDAVRVLTAHGAKGLEAKVVFLCDVGSQTTNVQQRPPVVAVPSASHGFEDVLVFAPNKDYQPPAVRAVLEAKAAAERDEHMRLLYVGMTRAERHLVICGSYARKKPGEGMWHQRVHAALAPDAQEIAMPGGTGLAWRSPPTTGVHGEPDPLEPPVTTARPHWLPAPALVAQRTPEPLAPSGGDHVAATGTSSAGPRPLDAASFGSIVHALLERDEPAEAMAARVSAAHPALGAADVAAVVAEAVAAASLPQLAPGTRTVHVRREVDVVGDIWWDGRLRRASGRIDRLQIDERRALIVDYKTDRIVPTTPAGVPEPYRRQLAIYRALVAAMLPEHDVTTAIVWTATQAFMPMDAVLPVIRVPAAA